MKKTALSLILGSLLAAMPAGARAQDAEEEAESTPRTRLRVLSDPYELADFYRGGRSARGDVRSDPYAIADYYRSDAGPGPFAGYSAPWAYGRPAFRAPFGLRDHHGRHAFDGRGFVVTPAFSLSLGSRFGHRQDCLLTRR